MLSNQKQVSTARKTRGYLQKKSTGFISIWQKRYFLILENSLAYYGDETLEEVKKAIELPEINSIKVVEDNEFHLVTKKRVYELRAEKENDRDLWVASLNILINSLSKDKSPDPKFVHIKTSNAFPTRPHSRSKKKEGTRYSPPPLRKMSSMNLSSSSRQEDDFEQFLFMQLGLPKLAHACKDQHILNKIILVKQPKSLYFVVSCKTPLRSHEDEDFLPEQLIHPLRLNTLYHCEGAVTKEKQAQEICRCSDIEAIQEEPHKLLLVLKKRVIPIELSPDKMDSGQITSLPKRLRHVIQISKEYFNEQGIVLRRNIDKMLYKFDSKEMHMPDIVRKEFEKCLVEEKEGQAKYSFRRNLEELRRTIRETIDCCDVLDQSRQQFKERFIREFYQQVLSYVQKSWGSLSKTFSLVEKKKILVALYDIWKAVRDGSKDARDTRMLEAAVSIHRTMMEHYEAQIKAKIDSCFQLEEKDILEELNLELTGDSRVLEEMNTLFYSNNSYRQFHVDIRLILYDFHEMPVHEQVLQQYLSLFKSLFRHISELTYRSVGRWKSTQLVLGTCNEIECIKNSLFEEMHSKLTSEYRGMSKAIEKQHIKELQNEISNTEILLIKNLFVVTFSAIDRGLLGKSYDELDIGAICSQILGKLRSFTKINKYVRKNILEASFQEICYFYYTALAKFNRKQAQHSAQFYTKKIAADIKSIGQQFEGHVAHEKIYCHLKDISLIKELLQCEPSQIKKTCERLKKEFGNCLTEAAFANMLSLRDMPEASREKALEECQEVIKYSAESDSSFLSSSMESFLDNWNNARSRKSTLTLSLNEFYENQQTIQEKKQACSVWKQGYLLKKKITKNLNSSETRAFFKINHSRLEQYESERREEIMKVFELHNVKRCTLHPDKPFMFFIQFHDFKLQLKAESAEEAKEWIKNIYEEVGALSTLKQIPIEKQRPSQVTIGSYRNIKDPSTMESFKTVKERSPQKSGSVSPQLKRSKPNSDREREHSRDKSLKTQREVRMKPEYGEDNCYKCSRGFFF